MAPGDLSDQSAPPPLLGQFAVNCLHLAIIFTLLGSIALVAQLPVIVALVLYAEVAALFLAGAVFTLAEHFD